MSTYISNTSRELNPSRPEDDSVRLREQRVRWALMKVAQTFANLPDAVPPQATTTQAAEVVPEASSNVLAFPIEQVSAAQRAVDTAYWDAA